MIYLVRKHYRLVLQNGSDIELNDICNICEDLETAENTFECQKPIIYNEFVVTQAKSITLFLESYDTKTGKTQIFKEYHI
jgi:hypothetical protein